MQCPNSPKIATIDLNQEERTLEDIAQTIRELKRRLKNNYIAFKEKQQKLKESKLLDKWQKMRVKNRKTFAFYINVDQVTPELNVYILNYIKQKFSVKIFKSWLLINNFLYFRLNFNMVFSDDIYLENGITLSQINPDTIIRTANKEYLKQHKIDLMKKEDIPIKEETDDENIEEDKKEFDENDSLAYKFGLLNK